MLDRRKAAILRAIVRDYVRTGQPVGSKALAGRARIRVSSATIRNDMAVLEELGFIQHPYTSAGRIPTDDGYRWFIDNWPGVAWPELPERAQQTIEGLVTSEFHGLEEALEETSQVLSDLTDATAVVVAPTSTDRTGERIFRGGTANILSPDKFADISTAHEVVEALEQPTTLTGLVEAARQAGGILIFIGREVPVEQMQTCAVVFAPYDVGSERRGALGVVGPTRMDYPRTISAVESVARSLSDWLDSAEV